MKNRENIYYWKCDRPSAFYSLGNTENGEEQIILSLKKLLAEWLNNNDIALRSANGQGNHLTFLANQNGTTYFIRVENGPEKDGYMLVENRIIEEIKKIGIPAPKIYLTDTSREQVDFAYQVMEYINCPDLNSLFKSGELDILTIAEEIGQKLAKWQAITPEGFGPFNAEILEHTGQLVGIHKSYIEYYYLNLNKHLGYLVNRNFLEQNEADDILAVIELNNMYLSIEKGCLVHKDLALWNILGYGQKIKSVIDWDDAISGDPTDDLSLLACFYPDDVIQAAIKGYKSIRELPENFYPRFYLHLLRNMIVKAVIRIGANYFGKSDDFFLIEKGTEGSSLEQLTRDKLFKAYEGLKNQTRQLVL